MDQVKSDGGFMGAQLGGWCFGCLDDWQYRIQRIWQWAWWLALVPVFARWANPKDCGLA
jgi:hypothetical protein